MSPCQQEAILEVPSGATAVALNVIVKPTANGHITVFPCGVDVPLASNLNYLAGDVIANNVIAPIGSDGSIASQALLAPM